jgi:hypothetical protein
VGHDEMVVAIRDTEIRQRCFEGWNDEGFALVIALVGGD